MTKLPTDGLQWNAVVAADSRLSGACSSCHDRAVSYMEFGACVIELCATCAAETLPVWYAQSCVLSAAHKLMGTTYTDQFSHYADDLVERFWDAVPDCIDCQLLGTTPHGSKQQRPGR